MACPDRCYLLHSHIEFGMRDGEWIAEERLVNEIEFVYPLSLDLEDRLRIRATKTRGRIVSFVVQYEALIQGEWKAIVRYDTAHRFAHKDIPTPRWLGG